MDELTVAIVHYHLRPGGVTRVIESTLTAIASLPVRAVVLSGDSESKSPIACAHAVPSLAYGASVSPETVLQECMSTAVDALGREPDLWHIHNHALGKNTALTSAVPVMAQRGYRLLLQIHDFAEDGRPSNYSRLGSRPEGAALYPSAPHIHYALLNRRDVGIMRQAGGDEDRIWFLPNPVLPAGDTESSAAGTGTSIVYPTRAIRRKNLGEFLLWAAVADEGSRFETTLAPTSPEDLPIYARWKELAHELGLPVHFEVGMRGDRTYAQILRDARAVMTTSVAEGFGLAFMEPWLVGRPVIGRDLPDITQDFRDTGVVLDGLYSSLPIPVSWIGERAVRDGIEHRVTALYAAYGRTPGDGLYEAFVVDGTIDFGRLDETMQAAVIRRARSDAATRNRIRELSATRDVSAGSTAENNRAVIESRYGLVSYGDRLISTYRSMIRSPVGTCSQLDATTVLDAFLKPERLSLLRVQ